MGILDDLAMGFGLKERDADYYDRTEQTLRRTQGDARGDIYARQTASVRADLANPAAFGRTGRDRSTFRGAGSNFTSTGGRPQSDPSMRGIFGAPTAMFGGNPSIRDFVPFLGLINQLTMRPRDTGAGYTMNTQRGTGGYDPSRVNAMLAASQTPQSANPASLSRAQASNLKAPRRRVGVQTPQVETSPLIGYGFEEDKFGFNPQTPRATLNDLDITLNPGYSQVADGQYVPSYNPFEATTAAQAQLDPVTTDLELSQWLQTEQGSRYNNPDLPEDFVRRMFETAKRLNAWKP